MVKIKTVLKDLLISGTMLTTLSISLNAQAGDFASQFASGDNSNGKNISSFYPTSEHQSGWGLSVDISDVIDNSGGTSYGSQSAVRGCKVSVYKITDPIMTEKINSATDKNKKDDLVMEAFESNKFEAVKLNTHCNDVNYFTMYYDSVSTYYTRGSNFTKAGSGVTGTPFNGYSGWLNRTTSPSNPSYTIHGNEINVYGLGSAYDSSITSDSSFYNTSVWQISGNNMWFAGANNGEIPVSAKQLAINITKSTTGRTYYGSTLVSDSDTVIYVVEPLVSIDFEDSDGKWYNGVLISPTMMAWAHDWYGNALSGLTSNWSERYVNLTGNDGLMAGEIIDDKGWLPDNPNLLKKINEGGLGAYAIPVYPTETYTVDDLPEIPSVPVFQKDGESVEYVGISSTVSQDCWNEITEVLAYAMHHTDTPPSNSLYNSVSNKVDYMRGFSTNAYKPDGSYVGEYASSYWSLWNAISRYYNNQLLTTNGGSVSMPRRTSTNQPSSITSVYGGTAPFKVEDSLGGISGANASYSTSKVSVYSIASNGIVDTNATSLSQLGSLVGDNVTFGNVLSNPYSYSIVIETPDSINTAGYPEPPNIVVWDENGGGKWEASIDAGSWTKVINTLKFAQGEDNVSNDLNSNYAKDARNYLETKISLDGADYTIKDSSKYEWAVNELENVKNYRDRLSELESSMGQANDNLRSLGNPHNVSYAPEDYTIYASYDGYINSSDSAYNHRDDWNGLVTYGYFGVYHSNGLNELTTSYNGSNTFKSIWQSNMDNTYYSNKYCKYYNNSTYIRWWSDYTGYTELDYRNTLDVINSTGRYLCPWDYGSLDNKSWNALRDIFSWLFITDSIDACDSIINNDIPSAKSGADDRIAVLEKFIKDYNDTATKFNSCYNNLLSDIPSKFADVYLVESSKNGTAVKNDVTDTLTQRNIGLKESAKAVRDMSIPWEYKHVKFSSDFKTASWEVFSNSSGTNWYTANKLMTPLGNSLKSTLDTAYSNANNELDFKYRVVTTGNPEVAMTLDSIADYSNASCYSSLNVEQLLKAPYSYGIILNNYSRKTSNTVIQEWQVSKAMEKTDLNLKEAWKWSKPNNSEDSKKFEFKDGGGNKGITIGKHELEISNNNLVWVSGKESGKTSPYYDGNGNVATIGSSSNGTAGIKHKSGQPTYTYDSTTKEDTAIYKLINNWTTDGSSGTGTIEILTANITAKSYKGYENTAVITGSTDLKYNPTEGSSFDIWRDNTESGTDGNISFRPKFPMSVALATSADKTADPMPVVWDVNSGKYIINPNLGTYNYGYGWFIAPHVHKIKSQYEVKVSYTTKSQITSTFSTDEEDLNSMDEILSTGDATPFVKAGQTFEVASSNGENKLIIDGYCNVINEGAIEYVVSNNQVFKVPADFINYMNGIANELSECNLAVYSTLNGINTISNVDNASFSNLYKPLATSHTEAGAGVDTDAGVVFKEIIPKSSSKSNETKLYGNYNFTPSPYIDYNASGPFNSLLSLKTQTAYDGLINTLKGDRNWYFEFSEVLGMVHCRIVIDYGSSEFGVTISRYESDFKTSTDAYLVEQRNTINSAWESMFGYNTSLRKVNGGTDAHVICMGVDLTGLDPNGEARKLFTGDDGRAVQAILGVQTPIHVRGSIYDNT